MPVHLLLVEDNPGDALLLQRTLDEEYLGEYTTTVAGSIGEADGLLRQQAFDAALLDLFLPDSEGLETIQRLAAMAPNLPIVVLTGVVDEKIMPEAVRSGAQDYLVKGQSDAATIARLIRYAIDRKRTEEQLRSQRQELESKNRQLQEAQRRLEAYRDRYVDLYDFAPLSYITLDEDGYVQESNVAAAQLLNTDRDSLIGYPFSEHVMKEDVPAFLDHLRKCVEEQSEVTAELHLTERGGRLIVAQVRSIPVKGSKKDVTFCKTAIVDVTQRKQIEEMRLQSYAFLQAVIDAIPDPILVIGRDYRIALANRAAREINGDSEVASGCLPCYQASHHRDSPCTDECHPCPLRQTVDAKAPVTVTHTHYGAGGRKVSVEISAAPILDGEGNVTHIIEVCRDVTERKHAEEALKAARDSAEQSSRAKDEYLAALGQKLHDPLEPLVAGVSRLQARPDLDPAIRETLDSIRLNVEVEARLIDELRQETRKAREKVRPQRQRTI